MTAISNQPFLRVLLGASALATTAFAAPVLAQQAGSSDARAAGFAIPPQPLASAITAFGLQSGWQVTVDQGLLAGRTSPGVSGPLGPVEALSRLLAGTGLTWQLTDSRSVVLHKAPGVADNAITLGPVQVQGSAGDGGGTTAAPDLREGPTRPVHGYVAHTSQVATKTDTGSLLETPQTISVVTRDQIDAQQAFSLRQTLRYAPGVYFGDNTDDRIENFSARGFYLDEYQDGLKLLTQGAFIETKVDPIFLERVEVLEGPSSALYGQSYPAGIVDMVSRHPTADPVHEVQLRIGNWGHYEASGDFGGRLNASGTLQYRLTGLFRDTGTQVAGKRERRIAVAPAITWQPDANTKLTVLTNYVDDPKGGFWSSLPYKGTLIADPALPTGYIPTSINTSQPSFDSYKRTRFSAGTEFEHRFSAALKFNQNLRYTKLTSHYDELQADLFQADNHTIDRYTYMYDGHARTFQIDNRLQADVDTGPVHHTLLLGLDYQYTNRLDVSRYGLGPSLDLLAPNYDQTVALPKFNLDRRQVIDQTGVYLQDQIAWGGLHLTLAGREDWASTKTQNYLTAATTVQDSKAFTGRAGLSYVTAPGIAPYVAYASSFQPSSGTDRLGNPFKPTYGKQIEGGVKYQPRGFNALFTADYFSLTQSNVLTTDPVNANFQVQTGEVRSDGVEVSAVASPIKSLNLRASYTHLDPLVTHDNSGLQGKRPADVPRNIASLWADYTQAGGALRGFGLGGGGRYLGTQFANTTNTYSIPAVTIFDLNAHYDLGVLSPRLKGWSLAVAATNLTDKIYVSDCSNLYCRWGQRRSVIGTLDVKW
jgi:iron complex outermembrane recepter protein